jgi:thioredoxin reductase/Pyruvate/2-oxoacid:ferredoxin oxidoreductase delta subunit
LVEKLPEVGSDGVTSVPGVRVVGDLTGIPLLKFSADSGARAVQAIAKELRADGKVEEWNNETSQSSSLPPTPSSLLDLAIIGGGVAGISAALEAKKLGLNFQVFEATEPFSTVANFPNRKPIYTYPTGMIPAGEMKLAATVKEDLYAELEAQRLAAGIEPVRLRVEKIEKERDGFNIGAGIRAKRVIVAIGRSGNYRELGVPGEELDKVFNRLHDPRDHAGKRALVVGGGDSALETAIALAEAGADVTLSYRGREFARAKSGNVERLQTLPAVKVMLESKVQEIRQDCVVVNGKAIPNDIVFTMIGRDAPLEFFRRSRIAIRGEWTAKTWIAFVSFLAFCVVLYHWKSNHSEWPLQAMFARNGWFPFNMAGFFGQPEYGSFLYTLKDSMGKPSFYYTLAYSLCVVIFGVRRIRRRRTSYVTAQTVTLMFVQCLPLFLLPEIVLPWMGRNGLFANGGVLQWLADRLFESYDSAGYERAYWRAYGFILAFPLNVYNVFTPQPMWLWVAICLVQTFVIIPSLIYRYGKGVYCGWICSCGALAETLGDAHRTKMPHGPVWNCVNMVGQAVLGFALLLLVLRIAGWLSPVGARWHHALFEGIPFLNYGWSVDLFMAGILGVGMYFWFSGRVWCRFACPLAAAMHIYARFSRFRIFPEKSKCISCNVCTSVCHQGIDIMNFANKGLPMEDPQCVRCSACVQECPTGTLEFGRLASDGRWIPDKLPASPVRMREQPRD